MRMVGLSGVPILEGENLYGGNLYGVPCIKPLCCMRQERAYWCRKSTQNCMMEPDANVLLEGDGCGHAAALTNSVEMHPYIVSFLRSSICAFFRGWYRFAAHGLSRHSCPVLWQQFSSLLTVASSFEGRTALLGVSVVSKLQRLSSRATAVDVCTSSR
jgi:hypothetical protein